MSTKSVKAYANFPVKLRIEKDRYWYINELVSIKQNTTITKNLQLFEGFDHEISPNIMSDIETCPPVITFEEGALWDYSHFKGGHGVLAPKGTSYYLSKQIFDNINRKGTPVISERGIYSACSANNNIYTTFNPGSNTWEIVLWVHTPTDGFSDGECLFGPYSAANAAPKLCVDSTNHLVLSLASTANSCDIADSVVSAQTLSLDKDYKITLTFDGEKYTLKAGYNTSTNTWSETVYIEVTSSTAIYAAANQFCLGYCTGGTAWSKTINLSKTEIYINNRLAWRPYHLSSTIDKGILDVAADNGEAALYNVFVKNDGTVELSLSNTDKDGYYWAGTINVGAHSAYDIYKANCNMANTESITITDHKAGSFSATKYLKFNFDKLSLFFDQPYSILSKFTYSSNMSKQTGMMNTYNNTELFKINSGKIALFDGQNRGTVSITNGKTYWVFGDYVLDDGYSLYIIEDNGYTQATLPAMSQWTLVYKTTQTMLTNGEIWLGNNKNNNYWCGNIDLENTCIKRGDLILWQPFYKV